MVPGYSGGSLPGRRVKEKEREKKERQMTAAGREKLGRKSLKKRFRTSRKRQARRMMPRRLHKEQLGKGSSKIGTVRKSKTKKRKRMTGRMNTKWEGNGMRMNSLRSFFWSEERMEGSSLQTWWYMSECPRLKKCAQKKKVKGWRTEEVKNKATVFWKKTEKNEKNGEG